MEEEESEEVRELLQYNEETAGGIMTTDFVAVQARMTAGEAIEYIGSLELEEPLYFLYVVDAEGRLTGWIQLWELLKQGNRNLPLSDLAQTETITVHTDADQEEVARLAAKYDLSSLPVLDWKNKLVGRITIDDIMDVMEEEASEDIFRLAGSDDVELTFSSPWRASRTRLPWLVITMFITFLSSLILKRFFNLSEVIALGLFVPIVLAMCGSTGMQSSTLIIRSLSLGRLEGISVPRLVGRELVTGLIMGLVCGVLLWIWAQVVLAFSPEYTTRFSALFLAVTAGTALISAMIFAAAYGALIPILLNKAGLDPAVSSGPFVTATNDIIGLLIYYGVTLLLVGMHQARAAG
jgi:magnesium transporter